MRQYVDSQCEKVSKAEFKSLISEVIKNHEQEAEREPNYHLNWSEDEMFLVEQVINPMMVADEAVKALKAFVA